MNCGTSSIPAASLSVFSLDAHRQTEARTAVFSKFAHFPAHYAHHLVLGHTLHGHSDCVNRLAWNKEGSLLASGSDDRKVLLWQHPYRGRPPLAINTQHELNIFGVEFLPGWNSSKIISAAYDSTVELHDLERATAFAPGAAERLATLNSVDCDTTKYRNHSESVKDVAVQDGEAYVFWSAAEDGRIHQYDLRCPHHQPHAENMLVRAPQASGGRQVQFKSLDISPTRPWLVAAACSDRFIRVYDRRRLSLCSPDTGQPAAALLSLAPFHLLCGASRGTANIYATCARFSNQGDRIIATYHREQAYTFDVTGADAPPTMMYLCHAPLQSALQAAALKDELQAPALSAWPHLPLDPACMLLRSKANKCVFESKWQEALDLYNNLLDRAPWFSQGYTARAVCLLNRGWRGDAWAALRDADTCVALSPDWPKSYETRIRCLRRLGQAHTALRELELLLLDFPGEAASLGGLHSQLREADAGREKGRPSGESAHASDMPYGPVPPACELRRARAFRGATRAVWRSAQLATSPSPLLNGWTGALNTASQAHVCDGSTAVLASRSTSGHGPPPPSQCDMAVGVQSGRAQKAAQPGSFRQHASLRERLRSTWDVWLARGRGRASWEPAAPDGCAERAKRELALQAHGRAVRPCTSPIDHRLEWGGHAGTPLLGPGEEDPGAAAIGTSPSPGADGASADDAHAETDVEADLVRRVQRSCGTGAVEQGINPLAGPLGVEVGATDVGPGGSGHGASDRPAQAGLAHGAAGEGAGPLDLARERAVQHMFAGEDNSSGSDGGEVSSPGEEEPLSVAELCSLLYGHVPWESSRGATSLPGQHQHAGLEGLVANSMRTAQRFVGHCNTRTDIKEATFLGRSDEVVAVASDHGHVFLFSSTTGALLRILSADREVVNCVQGHPSSAVLATSGLDDVVKLWHVDWDADAARLGSCVEEAQYMAQRNQADMDKSVPVFSPAMLERIAQRVSDQMTDILEGPPGSQGLQCNQS